MISDGYLVIPQNHKEPIQFVYKSGIHITCNEIPTFSEQDNAAITSRLFVVETTALTRKNPRATNWLRMHCMECFHWGADQLKNVPVWELHQLTETDSAETDQGAIYNDYDNHKHGSLTNIAEIEKMEFSQDFSEAISAAKLDSHPDVLPTELIDEVITRQENEEDWKREGNEIHLPDGDINSRKHHSAVFALTTIDSKSEELRPTVDNYQRFQRRRRTNWENSYSMYDAWLLIEDTPREMFNMELFKERFPHWEELMMKKYGKDRCSYIVKIQDGSDDSDEGEEHHVRPKKKIRKLECDDED